MDCLRCRSPLPSSLVNTDRFERCPSCGAKVRADVFPSALKKDLRPDIGATVIDEGSAQCFYHPGKAAVAPCGSCGRLLCALCDVELTGEHICFSCLESGKKKKKRMDLENHRTLYDGIALRVALVPLLIFWFTCITAPVALYLSIRHYRTPSSIIPRTKVRYFAAGFLALFQIAGWVFGIFTYVTKK
jgi:hypothetical protein